LKKQFDVRGDNIMTLIESDVLKLRESKKDDLNYIKKTESDPRNKPYIFQWSKEKHLNTMKDEDFLHIIIEEKSSNEPVGYIIMAGLLNEFNSLEFMRFAISRKSRGYGTETMKLVKKMAFEIFHAHRLWLDVKEHNKIARNLYEKQGFTFEGILRDYVIYEGKYENVVLMSILEEEYF